MANRLYYQDPQRLEFDATVTGVTRLDGRPAAALDTTAFYPTSGGQPFDTGLVHIEQAHEPAVGGKTAGGGRADAGGSTGDEYATLGHRNRPCREKEMESGRQGNAPPSQPAHESP